MPQPARLPAANALLAALPSEEQTLLVSVLERVPLTFKQVVQEIDRPVEHLWFPLSGVGSILSDMSDGGRVEVATVGREGMYGLPIVLGAQQSSQLVFVQIPGEAERLSAADYLRLRDRLPQLNRLLLRYALALVTQIAQGSACNRLHAVETRCARWLLQTHDRVDGDSFPLTHEFLADMLGVTRPSVSIAAGMLQKAGLIFYSRGEDAGPGAPGGRRLRVLRHHRRRVPPADRTAGLRLEPWPPGPRRPR